jgi:hypothetical protein
VKRWGAFVDYSGNGGDLAHTWKMTAPLSWHTSPVGLSKLQYRRGHASRINPHLTSCARHCGHVFTTRSGCSGELHMSMRGRLPSRLGDLNDRATPRLWLQPSKRSLMHRGKHGHTRPGLASRRPCVGYNKELQRPRRRIVSLPKVANVGPWSYCDQVSRHSRARVLLCCRILPGRLVVECTRYKSPRANLCPRRLREQLARESEGTGRGERRSASLIAMALFATESNSWTPSHHIVDSKECERGPSAHIPALQSAAHGHVARRTDELSSARPPGGANLCG